ncbi:oxidoreductase [Phlyctema vagabunda]|uniref:Oxidoreductase n=1 Tax=Phlyctema vagabunda TaxID=108571 RepID=A0ABR4PWT7_9HELO
MAPHADLDNDDLDRMPAPPRPTFSARPPRLMIIGAGSRGNSYARATGDSTNGIIVAVAEPIAYKRQRLGELYIWGKSGPGEGQSFSTWREFVVWELERREREKKGEEVPEGIDGVFICVLDEMHKEVIVGLAPLGLHIMCEKPLATTLQDCVDIYRSLLPTGSTAPSKIFSIGHVLRYSPHNMLLRKLLLEDRVIGDIMSVNHTEPVGWWHFTHSYVRGNWRKESTTAPSLLTKSCHDIDLLLWMLCSPPPDALPSQAPHIPSTVSSSGALQYFNRRRKPAAAGPATNCLSCPIEEQCKYSAKSIYMSAKHRGLATGNTDWPIDIVLPEIEECIASGKGEEALLSKLSDDYEKDAPIAEIEGRNWFGRCVYEADNDVCDEQVVTMTWDPSSVSTKEDGQASPSQTRGQGQGAKTAIFHMVAHTVKQCDRYTYYYGTEGEIYADSSTITVQDFSDPRAAPKVYRPHLAGGGHGGGDDGLARQFILAIDAVKNGGLEVRESQRRFVGCSLEECIRSHAMVFAAEEARTRKLVVDFPSWWEREVQAKVFPS